MMKLSFPRLFLIIPAVFLFAPGIAVSSETIRVAIADNQRSVALRSSVGLIVAGVPSNGNEKKMIFSPASLGGGPARVKSRNDLTQVNGRKYRGWVELRRNRAGLLLVINDLDLEDYLKGVVAAEIPHAWEFEALKAQAVAARTYALYQKRTSGKRSYHILATVSSQVYRGNAGERSNAVKAVQDTKGLVIDYGGEIIPAFYHADCGGHTEDAAELWGIDVPYLKGVECECQRIAENGVWEKRISVFTLADALRRKGYGVGVVSDLSIRDMTPAGRVKHVAVTSSGANSLIPGETLRSALGNTVIPSVFFELEISGDEAVFSGRGRGHGVGLCQWGAKEMAQRGHDFKAILAHYYPGTSLSKMEH
jgi:stage II sporulation protein D